MVNKLLAMRKQKLVYLLLNDLEQIVDDRKIVRNPVSNSKISL